MKIDPHRWKDKELWELDSPGIYVSAQTPEGRWESVDIIFLDEESLEEWLKKLGKEELIHLVKILLQHED